MFKYLFINSKFNKYVDNLEIDSIFVDEINNYINDINSKQTELLERHTTKKERVPFFARQWTKYKNSFDDLDESTQYQIIVRPEDYGAYTIRILPKVFKLYKKYTNDLKQRFISRLLVISKKPINLDVKKINVAKGLNCFRARVGEYRIIYHKADNIKTLFVILIAHRREVYQKL